MKHAIIMTGGKQYRVAEGDVIFVEKLDVEAGETVKFDKDDENSYASQMVDYFKDTAIQTISDEITDQEGGSFAQMMYEQMKRNYNL